MLDERAIAPAMVRWISAWGNQSPMVRSSTFSFGGTMNLVRGVTLPASSSDEAVSTFSTEPGS